MSSLRLQTSLKQQMVLTPQLRQRIEMLQMTSVELQDLISQEMVSNPVLEEVQSDEEFEEISEKILDQNSNGNDESYLNGADPDADIAAYADRNSESLSGEKISENGFDENHNNEFEGDTEDY